MTGVTSRSTRRWPGSSPRSGAAGTRPSPPRPNAAATCTPPPTTSASGSTAQGQRLDQLGRAIGAAAADAGRTPSGADAAAAAPPAAAAPELAAAGQLADEADRHGQQADALARRPALLPTWSPLARAAAVYTCAALAGAVLMLVMVVASGLAVVGLGTLYASMCAGLPVASFVAGYLVLGRWGRPVLDGDAPASRFVPLGFVICVLLVPLVYCAYLLAFRVLR